jgi:hypothetical protein
MEVSPVERPCATPVALIEAMEEALELHVTNAVRSWLEPLLYVPVAKNESDEPVVSVALVGLIAKETSCDVGMVIAKVPQIELAHALIVALPGETPYTAPALVESLVTVAIAVLEELHETEASVCTVPSLKVPVAAKRCAPPSGTEDTLGLTAMETKEGRAVVAG